MTTRLSRRDFVLSGGAALPVANAALRRASSAGVFAPAVILPPDAHPCVVAAATGFGGVQRAYEMIMQGADTLDAGVECVKVPELDPDETSVGYGGLPNAEGVVQLDASCMHGPTRRAGGVGALEGIKTPSEIARLVLRYTDHVLLVGEGAQRFAVSFGYRVENLLTDRARQAWLRWRSNLNPNDAYLDVPEGEVFPRPPTGTVNCNVINARGDISSITSTSGRAWKLPGRLGDSPIHGAGQYTDNDIGAAGSTGWGEINIKICGGFLTVDNMRRGMSPTDACLETLRRAVHVAEDRLLDAQGRPKFDLTYYAVNKRGEYGAATMYGGYRAGKYAVCDERGPRLADLAHLHEGDPPQ
jgi:N4-(beta-N-acetylglucosaminyl)-L-asparaginase